MKERDMQIDEVLKKIEKEVRSGRRFLPIVGPKKGAFLYLVAKSSKAKKVLDLGTLIGYSALLLSKAMGKGGRVVSVEKEHALVGEARANAKAAGVRNITFLEGDAKMVIKKTKTKFDLILLDVWKEDYVKLLPLCVQQLRSGGVLIADNASWDTDGMRKFREALKRNKNLESVLVPVQDGMSFSVKR